MAPHPKAGPHSEDPPLYLLEVPGVTQGLTDKDLASFNRYRRHPRHETEELTQFGETENSSSFRHGSKSHRTWRGTIPEEEGEYSKMIHTVADKP